MKTLSMACALIVVALALPHSPRAPRPAPLSIVVLIDVTASMHVCPGGVAGPPSTASGSSVTVAGKLQGQVGYVIPPAVEPFLLQHVAASDRVRIGAIGRRLYLADRFTSDRRERDKQWQAAFAHPPIDWLGPSPLWDALREAAAAFDAESGRRAIVLVTDGEASGNLLSAREAADALASAGVSVSVVAEETIFTMRPLTPMASRGVDPTRSLRAISDTTGGTFVLDKAVGDFGQPCFRRDPATALGQAFDWLHAAVSTASR